MSKSFHQPPLREIFCRAFGLGTVLALGGSERIGRLGSGITENFAMLRITTDEQACVITLRLEGRLEGPWVTVLDNCWSSTLARSTGKRLRIDLTSVMFIDASGKARLAQMHQQGAELIAGDLETRAILAEILRP